jgi:hypothetical protein
MSAFGFFLNRSPPALGVDRREASGQHEMLWRGVFRLPVCPRPIEREASEALAVHLEHRRRDLVSARDFAVRLLRVDGSVTRRQAAEYRLARLDRKLESRASQPALLF